MSITRKAINFDLELKKLRKYYNSNYPNQAYFELEKYMESNGFIHRQYSGYISVSPMKSDEIVSFVLKLSKDMPWLYKCAKRFDVTSITNIFDGMELLEAPYKQKPIVKDVNKEKNKSQSNSRKLKHKRKDWDLER